MEPTTTTPVLPDPYEQPTMSIEEACVPFGIGRSLAYDLAKRGQFPVPVLRVGRLYRVPTMAVWQALGLTPPAHARRQQRTITSSTLARFDRVIRQHA